MPSKKVPPKRSGPAPNVDPEVALKELTRLMELATELKGKKASPPEFGAWESDVKVALSRFYGPDSEEYARFQSIWFSPGMYYPG